MEESVGYPTDSFTDEIDVDYTAAAGVEDPVALPYTRYQRANLAPWLTGLILALVVFVILIPAFCSACYHYYSYKHGFEDDSDLDEIDYEGDINDDEDDDCCEYCCTDEQHFEKTMLFQDTAACKPSSSSAGGGLKLRLPEALRSSCCSCAGKKHHSHADLAATPKSTCSSLPSERSGGGGQLIRTPSASANSNVGFGGSQAKPEDFSTPVLPGQQGNPNGMKLRLFKGTSQKDGFSPTTESVAVDSSSQQTSGSDSRQKFKPATPSPPPPPPTATNGSFYLNDLGKIGGNLPRKPPAVTSCLCPKHSSAAAAGAAVVGDLGVLTTTKDSETQTLVTSLVPTKHRFVRKKSETCKIATSMGEYRKSSSKKRCGRNHHDCALSNNSHVHSSRGVHRDKFELVCETSQVERAKDKYSAANEESYDF